MEDVKEQIGTFKERNRSNNVSILVLMEDVKEHLRQKNQKVKFFCFNPCFNGRCKRTITLFFL